jgi:hypothetical protein
MTGRENYCDLTQLLKQPKVNTQYSTPTQSPHIKTRPHRAHTLTQYTLACERRTFSAFARAMHRLSCTFATLSTMSVPTVLASCSDEYVHACVVYVSVCVCVMVSSSVAQEQIYTDSALGAHAYKCTQH